MLSVVPMMEACLGKLQREVWESVNDSIHVIWNLGLRICGSD